MAYTTRVIIVFIFLTINFIADCESTVPQPTRDLMPLVGTRAMMQDSEGYVWYGTVEGGLCRDNGYQIDVFRNDRDHPHRIGQSNGILSVCEDSNGDIVFGTRKNIFILHKDNYHIDQLCEEVPDGRVWSVTCDADGILTAISESGTYTFSKDHRLLARSEADTDFFLEPECGFTDRFGNLWHGGMNMETSITLSNRPNIHKSEAIAWPEMLPLVRHDFIVADSGYIGHTFKEIFWTKTIEPNPTAWEKLLDFDGRLTSVALSKDNWLYIGSSAGLYRVRYDNGKAHGSVETVADSLGNIRQMATASDGRLYFITPYCNLAFLDNNGTVKTVEAGADSKALAVDSKGIVWTTDWFGTIYRYDPARGQLELESNACTDTGDPVNAMTCDSDGNLWLVTDKTIKQYMTDGHWRILRNNDRYIDVNQFMPHSKKAVLGI